MSQPFPLQKLTDAVNANLQTYLSFAEIILNSSERLSSLNLEASRSAFQQFSASVAPLSGDGIGEQITARINDQGRNLEQAVGYLRNVGEVYAQTQSELAELGSRRVAELTEELQALLDKTTKSAPAGTSEMVTALKTALRQATSVYDSLMKTSREMTETNLAAATKALQPITAASSRASKKAA